MVRPRLATKQRDDNFAWHCQYGYSKARALVGKSLKTNVKKLGYRDVESFLVELNDEGAVTLEHTFGGGYLFRAGKADSSTSHIQALVKKQVTKSSRSKGRRSGGGGRSSGGGGGGGGRTRSTPPAARREFPKALQANIVKLLRDRKGETSLCNIVQLYHNRFGGTINYRSSGFHSLREAIGSIDELIITVKGDAVSVSCAPVGVMRRRSGQSVIKPVPLMSSSSYDDVRSSLSKEITKVLGNEEIPLTKFADRYAKIIGQQLSPAKHGFSSLLQLLNDLVETVNLERVGEMGDWMVSHVTRARTKADSPNQPRKRLPYELIKIIRKVVEGNPKGIYLANFDQTFKLETGMDLSPHTYGYGDMSYLLSDCLNEQIEIMTAKFGAMIRVKPSAADSDSPPRLSNVLNVPASLDVHDAVGPGVCYNRVPVPPVNRYIEVIVSQVYSPGNFYIQVMAHENTGKRLEELMDTLEATYSEAERNKSYLLPSMLVTPGQLVVCRFPNDRFWHRARISKVIDINFVQVMFVDYGTSCAVHRAQLYYLREKFLLLPAQAQSATLFGISPVGGAAWSTTSSKAFLNLTADKSLCGIVMTVDRDQRLALCLTDTTGLIDLHINDYLVTSNFAAFSDSAKDLPQRRDMKTIGELLNLSSCSDSSDEDHVIPVSSQSKCLASSVATNMKTTIKLEARSSVTITSLSNQSTELATGPQSNQSTGPAIKPQSNRSIGPTLKPDSSRSAEPAVKPPSSRSTGPTGKPQLNPSTEITRARDVNPQTNNSSRKALVPTPASHAATSPNIRTIIQPLKSKVETKSESEKRHDHNIDPQRGYNISKEAQPMAEELTKTDAVFPDKSDTLTVSSSNSNSSMPPLEPDMTTSLELDTVAPPLEPDTLDVLSGSCVLPSQTLTGKGGGPSKIPPLELVPNRGTEGIVMNDGQMPYLEMTKKTVLHSDQRLQQTATVRPQRQPHYRNLPPRLQPGVMRASQRQPQLHHPQPTYYNHNQMPPLVVHPSQQMYMAQSAAFTGQPFIAQNPQYHMYPNPYPNQYNQSQYNQPYLLQPNPYYPPSYSSPLGPAVMMAPPRAPYYSPPSMSAPPHIVCTSEPADETSQQEVKDNDSPPPLMHVSETIIATSSAQSDRQASNDMVRNPGALTADVLRYKLRALKLKHKRLGREHNVSQSADYSGAEESDDDEILAIERDIEDCKRQLAQMNVTEEGILSCGSLPQRGRGRGRLHLMALTSDD